LVLEETRKQDSQNLVMHNDPGSPLPILIQELYAWKARIIVILDQDIRIGEVEPCLPRIPTTPKWVTSLHAAIRGQLFALGVILVKGLDPADRPRGLTMGTITRQTLRFVLWPSRMRPVSDLSISPLGREQ
jgi:hypothetical protein